MAAQVPPGRQHPPDAGGSFVDNPLAVGSTLFTGNDGTYGNELWKSDGTESGTVL
jgi:hypothetical protein